MTEGKKFVITEEQRSEILRFMISRNYSSSRNMLNQLPTLEEFLKDNQLNKKEEEKNGNVQ